MKQNGKVAVLIPCFNEEIPIGNVIRDFKRVLPDADVFVYDNNSTDSTCEVAAKAGAFVYSEPLQGKGNVVRRMFADIEADVYVLIDGDGTYDVNAAPEMIEKLEAQNLDMVVGVRKEAVEEGEAYRKGHAWGNLAFNKLFSLCFSDQFTDIFSGYRCFSRRFVKSFPALSSGFEIETEISSHAYNLKLPTIEVDTKYYARPEGSYSKLNTYSDGLQILWTIIKLYKEIFPLRFFGLVGLFGALLGLMLGVPLFVEYAATGLVPRFPTAILASAIMTLSGVSFVCGLILDGTTRGRLEQKRLWYLSLPRKSKDR